MLDRILLAADDGPGLWEATRCAALLASETATVTVFHVAQPRELTDPQSPPQQLVARVVRELRLARTPVKSEIETARDAAQAIQQAAARLRPDLLILGYRQGAGWADAFLGPTASRVVEAAPCPVLIAGRHPAHLGKNPRVLLSFDGDRPLAAVSVAAELALRIRAAVTVLWHSHESHPQRRFHDTLQPPVSEALRLLRAAGVEASARAAHGPDIAHEIGAAARDVDADMLVVSPMALAGRVPMHAGVVA